MEAMEDFQSKFSKKKLVLESLKEFLVEHLEDILIESLEEFLGRISEKKTVQDFPKESPGRFVKEPL